VGRRSQTERKKKPAHFGRDDRLAALAHRLALPGRVRDATGFRLIGYVVMPEHVHLLISEPREGTPRRCCTNGNQAWHGSCANGNEPAPRQLAGERNTIFDAGLEYGIVGGIMATARKITVEVPLELLEKAQRASGTGVTQTVRTGLQLVAASQTYARLRRLRGKVRFSRTVAELKADR